MGSPARSCVVMVVAVFVDVDVDSARAVATKTAKAYRRSIIMIEVCYVEYDSREGACIATTWLRH